MNIRKTADVDVKTMDGVFRGSLVDYGRHADVLYHQQVDAMRFNFWKKSLSTPEAAHIGDGPYTISPDLAKTHPALSPLLPALQGKKR